MPEVKKPAGTSSSFRCVVANTVCGLLLHGFAVVLSFLCVPNCPEVGFGAFISVAVPMSIVIASRIDRVTYRGMAAIGCTQIALCATMGIVEWRPIFPRAMEMSDFVEIVIITVAVGLPVIAIECGLLFMVNFLLYGLPE